MSTTDLFERIEQACGAARERFLSTALAQELAAGTVPLEAYKGYLKETFHFTKHTPRFLAAAAARFPREHDDVLKRFLKHGLEEWGHDRMALSDLQALGEDAEAIANEEPLVSTTAMVAFHYHLAERLDPIGMLGTVYAMEGLGEGMAGKVAQALVAHGMPEAAVTFLANHGELDVGHMRDARRTMARHLKTEAQIEAAIYAARAGFELYAFLFEQVWDRYEKTCARTPALSASA